MNFFVKLCEFEYPKKREVKQKNTNNLNLTITREIVKKAMIETGENIPDAKIIEEKEIIPLPIDNV
jgi:hypothetical protein